jgi:hypothetical protein
MDSYTQTLRYALERQKDLLPGPDHEQIRLGYGWPLFEIQKAVRRAVDWFVRTSPRENDLCLDLAPACELQVG